MSQPIATYSFLPWLRQGLSNKIEEIDGASIKERASIKIGLNLNAVNLEGKDVENKFEKDIRLFGPGDIVGIEQQAIIKTEPHNWITNFEPNYLPFIDFYDEDFPWRYTPAKPDEVNHRLRPWIALIVLKEGEFEDGKNLKDKPLPFVEVTNAATLFPPADQLWAWAHVHVNKNIGINNDEIVSNDGTNVATRLQDLLNENRDWAYSRILCPRHLEDNAAYHAFLMPVFETGRLAGLGLDQTKAPKATTSAWDMAYPNRAESLNFPYYHRWYFRTGTVGDFEYLVRLLKPQPVDSRVGTRDMDVQAPAPYLNIHGITHPDLGGVLKLGGALRIPVETMKPADKTLFEKYDKWANTSQNYEQPFQNDLATFINLADDYSQKAALIANTAAQTAGHIVLSPDDDQDPLITPPLYGTWHALEKRLLLNQKADKQNWVNELNLDPRFRAAAGIGTGVVAKNQEKYMETAWEQVGEVLEANRKLRQAQFAKTVSFIWWKNHLEPLQQSNPEKLLLLTSPVQRRVIPATPSDVVVLANGVQSEKYNVYKHLANSPVSRSILSVPMRQAMRPGARIMRQLPWGLTAETSPHTILSRLNDGSIVIVPPKTVPAGVTTATDIAQVLKPKNLPSFLEKWLRKYTWLKYVPLVLAFILFIIMLIFKAYLVLSPIIAGLIALYFYLVKMEKGIKQADSVLLENQTPESVDALPKSPDFRITNVGETVLPTFGNVDNTEGVRFKEALKSTYTIINATIAAGVQPPKIQVKITAIAQATLAGINPKITIPQRYFQNIQIPTRIRDLMIEQFVEAWAYPKIDLPMYEPLTKLSSELFLPNINFVEQNSISLLETNQKFIEAYMVGLNHEMARELLWREYPTDQRGSYFRQFWDVSSFLSDKNLDAKVLRERLYDIPKLHRWSKTSKLGDHDNREINGDKEEEVVLVIRGELLKKYPTAVVYAHKAEWHFKPDGVTIDKTKPRKFKEIDVNSTTNPSRDTIKTPLYEAKVEPDIYFFGFDITAIKARGNDATNDAGWFFVIKERPGEPRFGLDIDGVDANKRHTWNDLAWKDVNTEGGKNLHMDTLPSLTLAALPASNDDPDLKKQHDEDIQVVLSPTTNSADLAYILYQVPVLMGVHGSEMLPKQP